MTKNGNKNISYFTQVSTSYWINWSANLEIIGDVNSDKANIANNTFFSINVIFLDKYISSTITKPSS